MKMALPPRKDCKYIKGKLKIFYQANRSNPSYPSVESMQFKRALLRLFHFFQLSVPPIEWYDDLGGVGCKILGQCTPEGTVRLLTPHKHGDNFEAWLNTVYHEVGHYVLWADCERKAREFAGRMCDR